MAGLLHRFGVLSLQTGEGEIDRIEVGIPMKVVGASDLIRSLVPK